MKFLSILVLSLIGTSVAAPLNNRAAASASASKKVAASATSAKAKATPTAAGAAGADAGAKTTTSAAKAKATPTAAAAADPAADSAASSATSSASSKPAAKASSTASADTAQASADASMIAKSPSAASVMYAAGAFANDAMTVSAALNALGTEQDPETIRAMASTAFTAESDEDQRRNVLNTVGGSAAKNANSLIVANTPTVLDGLQAIMNDPKLETSQKNLPTIEAARNPNILPSITELSNAAMMMAGLPQNAVVFPPTTGSSPQ